MRFFIVSILLFAFISSSAQYRRGPKYEINFGPGAGLLFGDIGNFGIGPAATTGFRYYFGDYFAAKGNMHAGLLFGKDEGTSNAARGLSYRTFMVEPSVQLEYFIFKERRGINRRGHMVVKPLIRPYIFGGGGGLYFSPVLKGADNENIVEDYNNFTFVITGGGGFIFCINRNWYWGGELGGRYVLSDYVDGYTSAASASKDLYYFTTINLIYRFTPSIRRRR